MNLKITSVDYAPADLEKQVPFSITLIKTVPGDDRPDYWLAKTKKPIKWAEGDCLINYVIVAPRFVGATINESTKNIVLGLAYVTDESLLSDERLDFKKSKYVAICEARRTLF